MRNVIFAINITLDGCCDHTKQFVDEEALEYSTHLLREFDLLVFGRKTYQLMVPYWPDIAKSRAFPQSEKLPLSPGPWRSATRSVFPPAPMP
jgi:hypothetical protein